jgi:hypothetical protein
VKKAQQSVACGTTHARKGRDGVAAGHRAALLSAGSGAVERIRRLPDGYQCVAQLLMLVHELPGSRLMASSTTFKEASL